MQKASTTFSLTVYAPAFTLYGSDSMAIGEGTSGTTYFNISSEYGFKNRYRDTRVKGRAKASVNRDIF